MFYALPWLPIAHGNYNPEFTISMPRHRPHPPGLLVGVGILARILPKARAQSPMHVKVSDKAEEDILLLLGSRMAVLL